MIEWGDLRFFLAVARAGNASAAAAVLGVNQTTVTRRVAALEEALGDRLFERAASGYRLTELGVAMLAPAERVEVDVEAFQRQITQRSRNLRGVIRVTTNEVHGNILLTPWLGAFAAQYPDIHIESLIDDRLLDLERGEADVAIRAGPVGTDSDKVVMRRLCSEAWAVYCSPGYAAQHGKPSSVDEIAGHQVVGVARPLSAEESWFWDEAKRRGGIVRASSSTLSNLAATVRSGLGVAPLPCLIGEFESGFERCFGLDNMSFDITLLTRAAIRDLPHIRIFTDFIVARIAPMRAMIEGRALASGREAAG